jgi:hypothetical protein
MLKVCIDPDGLEDLLEYGCTYWVTPLARGAVRVRGHIAPLEYLVCSGARFR